MNKIITELFRACMAALYTQERIKRGLVIGENFTKGQMTDIVNFCTESAAKTFTDIHNKTDDEIVDELEFIISVAFDSILNT